jgi:DnaJ-class molecular chaperone
MLCDYYNILGLTRSAELADIREAYRRAALKYHPDKSPVPDAKIRFNDASEAYQVLRNQRYRALYDRYGRRGLGMAQWIDENHSGEPPYSEDPQFEEVKFEDSTAIFNEFFATHNPHEAELLGDPKRDLHPSKHEQPPIYKTIYCTLEELYTGCQKSTKVYTKPMRKDLNIEVGKCWKNGTQVEFKGVGEESEKLLPADVIVTMEECPHPRFVREGNDLIYTHCVSLTDALCGTTVKVTTLDERILSIPINYVIT